MKKVRMIILFMTLFLGMFFFKPAKVFANSIFDGTAHDWFSHISQFDYGIAYSEIFQVPGSFGTFTEFGLLIVEEPSLEVDGCKFKYTRFDDHNGYWNYFEPSLRSALNEIIGDDYYANIERGLELEYGEDFDGYLYWNFEEGYWQIEYYEISELDYYIQRVDDLEDEISSLEDEISSLEDEISSLEDEISSLEDEIQQLENALDLEYDRGYNDGYEIGYSEGLLVNNNDVDIIKWFVPLVVIIIIVGIIEPIIILKRRG